MEENKQLAVPAFDPVDLVNQAIESDLDPSVFDEFDDSGIPRAKNWFEWCIGKQFLGIEPFPRQAQIAISLFAEYCPRCSDTQFLGNLFDQPLAEVQSRVQMLEYGVCPKCKTTQAELIAKNELLAYEELDGVAGMRSGKTALSGMISTYHLHRFLMLPSPSRYFGLLPNQTLHMTMCALTAGQAEETLWQAFQDLKDNSMWYKDYHKLLKDYEKRKGIGILQDQQTFLFYNHKRLVAYYTGSDQKKLRGRTRFFTSIDELGWFGVGEDNILMNADEMHSTLEKSLRTVRSAAHLLRKKGQNWVPTGLDVNISSPSSVLDKIMRLAKEAEVDKKKYAFHYSTWEMNPFLPYESFNKEQTTDSKTFWRDYGAVPPLSANPYINDTKYVERLLGKKPVDPILKFSQEQFTDDLGDGYMYARSMPAFVDKFTPRLLAIDIGSSNNAFGLVMMKYSSALKRCVAEAVLQVKPIDPFIIHSPKMYDECIKPILESFRIEKVLYDRWNSLDQIQRIRDEYKIPAEALSLKYQDFMMLRNNIKDARMLISEPELPISNLLDSKVDFNSLVKERPVLGLCLQLLTVRDIGRKILKPENGDDDLFRAWALGAHFMLQPENLKVYDVGEGAPMFLRRGARFTGVQFSRGYGMRPQPNGKDVEKTAKLGVVGQFYLKHKPRD